MKAIEVLYSRPGMYLLSYEDKIDATSYFANFLRAVFISQELGVPDFIDLTIAGQYFSIQATGCYLSEIGEYVSNPSVLFDISKFREPFFDKSISLGNIRPIVWYSDYCLTEFTIGNRIFRQVFVNGMAVAEPSELELGDGIARVSLFFTLPTRLFEDTRLEIGRFKRVINEWEERDIERVLSTRNVRFTFHKKWCEQSRYHYSARITPSVEHIKIDKENG